MPKIIALVLLTLIAGSSLAQPALTRKQAEADIDYYVQTMKASHYAPFQAMDEQTYDARIRQIKEKIGDTIEMKAFVWMMYEVTALIGDAHSTPQLGQPAFREEYAQPLFFPMRSSRIRMAYMPPVNCRRLPEWCWRRPLSASMATTCGR